MGDLQGRKVFKVFNQDFIVDERYTVTKELGQGAYGIVWWVPGFNLFGDSQMGQVVADFDFLQIALP